MALRFVHLNVHSEYSLVDGIVRIPALVRRVRQLAMPAVAITDVANVYGTVKFVKACMAEGVKPIVGVHVALRGQDDTDPTLRVALLCRDNGGYRSLCEALTHGCLAPRQHGNVCVDLDWLPAGASGLIALVPTRAGALHDLLQQGDRGRAKRLLAPLQARFDERLYLEVSRVDRGAREASIAAASLAQESGLALVATNEVRFLERTDFDAHEIRVCINEGRVLDDPRRPRRFTDEQYLRSGDEMAELFADLPEALANSVEIARRCNLFLDFKSTRLPAYPVPGSGSAEQTLIDQARAGLATLLDEHAAAPIETEHAQYRARLESELKVIVSMGFAGYYLIVADFIQWAKDHRIPVGPGRGSGAGSLVAWVLGITEIDPIAHTLLFERFLNPERVSLPDFDVDFCMEQRDQVIEYVAGRYGHDRVAQIITFGSMAARAVVRDVGRVMGLPYGLVDTVAKLVPFAVKMTLDRALTEEPVLRERYDSEPEIRELIDQAKRLEGLPRNVGKHAGGVVIAPSPLTDYMPLYADAGMSQPVTQFDKDDLENIGLVKFDFLGLRTLTIIDWAVALANTRRAHEGLAPIDVRVLPGNDAQTFELIRSGKTTGLFQLESRGMKDLIIRLQPDQFDDLVALVALFRPGPLESGMVGDFVKRKHGREKVVYPHPELEEILKPTYGVILYQEQVMQIAQVLAGFTLGSADLLRSAMGKKKAAEMAMQRSIFVDGAISRGVDAATAAHIFDLMEKFAGYGFNKSHSVAYAVITYQTAWLKTHYRAEYMAATLSSDMEHTDRVVTLIAECRELNVAVETPDVNRCRYEFTPAGERAVLYGLGAVKGVGRAAVEMIVAEREAGGPFQDLADFCRRIDSRRINKRALEALTRAGALDALGEHRAQLLADLPGALKAAGQYAHNVSTGQGDLFGLAAIRTTATPQRRSVPPWSAAEQLAGEKDTLGLYLSGHPLDPYIKELTGVIDTRLAELNPAANRAVVVAGLIVAVRTLNTRRGDKMCFVTLDDNTARLDVSVFADQYQAHREQLRKDQIIVIAGEVDVDDYTGGFQMRAEHVHDIANLRSHFVERFGVELPENAITNGQLGELQSLLERHRGGNGRVVLRYRQTAGPCASLAFGTDWCVTPSEELLGDLARLIGASQVKLGYNTAALRQISNTKRRMK